MLKVRLAGDYLYGKQLFTWLSLGVSLVASFCAVIFPLDVLDETWDVIESASEEFLTYYCSFTTLAVLNRTNIVRHFQKETICLGVCNAFRQHSFNFRIKS